MKEQGFCPICEQKVNFIIEGHWLRDQFKCEGCGSIPRNRALMRMIQLFVPDFREKAIHESSPSGGTTHKFIRECPQYTYSFYFPDVPPGSYRADGLRCENLERMTFKDNSFDLFITQDVMEHVLHPVKAFQEIARVLKPGGFHIFTVPLYKGQTTVTRVIEENGTLKHLLPEVYHGNPIDENGSLVITDWGYDILNTIRAETGMESTIYSLHDRYQGIDAEFIEVIVSQKPFE